MGWDEPTETYFTIDISFIFAPVILVFYVCPMLLFVPLLPSAFMVCMLLIMKSSVAGMIFRFIYTHPVQCNIQAQRYMVCSNALCCPECPRKFPFGCSMHHNNDDTHKLILRNITRLSQVRNLCIVWRTIVIFIVGYPSWHITKLQAGFPPWLLHYSLTVPLRSAYLLENLLTWGSLQCGHEDVAADVCG